MSYEEKGTWVYLAVAVAGYAVYLSLVLPQLKLEVQATAILK